MKSKKAKKVKKSSRSKRSPEKKLSVVLPPSNKKGKGVTSPARKPIKKRKLYSKEALQAAYKAVKDSSISVNAAAKQYGVPLTTLRDRVDGRISIDTTRPGPPLLLTQEEESEISHFLHTMAKYGYRYTRLELAEIATDQAVEKGKRSPRSNGLTTKWVDSFINRWPSIRELSYKFKNKMDAEHTVRTYFDEIKKIIDRYKLLEKSDKIYNIMEIVLTTDHGPAPSVSGKSGHQFKTTNSTNTTLIACGSVTGKVIAPFFVFQASKIRTEMMKGLPSNVNAAVSEIGRCTPQIFRRYLNEHFLPQTNRLDNEPILVLMDGSRSHVFVGMSEWGRSNNVIFSFIPAHTTHLLQPIEVECSEILQKKYESLCLRYLKSSGAPNVSRNNVGELAYQAYSRVMTKHALMHSFKKSGVFPDISSDESGDDMDTCEETTYKGGMLKSDESMENQDEVIFTEDLVVGHNQEVTEEEVVTTQEVVVLTEDGSTEEMVITPEGHFMLAQNGDVIVSSDGHLVIHDGELFVNSSEGGYSHLESVQLIQTVNGMEQNSPLKSVESDKLSPVKPCLNISDGNIIDTCTLDLDSNSNLNSTDNGLESLNSTDNVGDQNTSGSSLYSSVNSSVDNRTEKHSDSLSELDSSSTDGESDVNESVRLVIKEEISDEDLHKHKN
ncbi:uncharacterized protein LOC131947959 [Physella acuta]|uniref:uncharacterized protein LOC131947959 n=1 Tax=Physella acuta TaxID=109671 RepID=UPI0027DB2196|nr:uncharacterized protein LOC131947959 [Physella acuta]